MTKHTIYALAFLAQDEPVIFYVGHTNNAERRRSEHQGNPFNPNHREYMTMKYRWCRSLKDLGIDYDLIVLHDDVLEDDVTEYVKILEIARDNKQRGITFYDDLPLTNMKAGDMLDEMLRENVRTYEDIIAFHDRHDSRRTQAMINYQRDLNSDLASVRNSALDWFSPTPEPNTQKARQVKLWLREHADKNYAEFQQSILSVEVADEDKDAKYQAMLADPKRKARIEEETKKLMALDAEI